MRRLPREQEQIVLRAMSQMFIEHGLCLREQTESGPLLIFPSYFRRERPDLGHHPEAFVTYEFTGHLDEIYATLVVRLHHTPAFDSDQLWRFAADFKTPEGKRLGIKMIKKADGTATLTIYCEPTSSEDAKVTFIRYVHDHLKAKASSVKRTRHYICPLCSAPVENSRAVTERLLRGLTDIVCADCENRVPLNDLIEKKFASDEIQEMVRQLESQAVTKIDNESRELILVGHAFAIAGEAGQIYRGYTNSDHGIDGEIEFKDYSGKASGQRLYLQLKSGDSYLYERKKDGREIFTIKSPRHAQYWQAQAYPVMLVIRESSGLIRWMDVTEYLSRQATSSRGPASQIEFKGEPFTALSVQRMRDKVIRPLQVRRRGR
jgi:DNA-directed RNA polymerase subunit RPC12/RpoP